MTQAQHGLLEQSANTPARLVLPRDEMAFRKRYQDCVTSRSLTVVFRPGDRTFPRWRGYCPGELVTARIIEKCGNDQLGIPPIFTDLRIPIRIRAIKVDLLRHLGPEDFIGSSSDVTCQASLAKHLSEIYCRDISDPDTIISRISFNYVD